MFHSCLLSLVLMFMVCESQRMIIIVFDVFVQLIPWDDQHWFLCLCSVNPMRSSTLVLMLMFCESHEMINIGFDVYVL